MTGLRIAIIVVGLVVISPIIALNVWGMNMSLWANEVTAQNDAELSGEMPLPEVRPMPTSPLTWFKGRIDLRDTFSTDTLTNERYIVFEEVIEPEELLTTAEAMPNEDFVDLYAAARAPGRFIRYCEDVLQSIGHKCDVIHTDTRRNRQGKLELLGRLAFIPVVDLGDPSTVENGQLISTQIMLPYDGDLAPANDAKTRVDLIRQAQAVCDDLRDQLGNCVLSRVAFDVSELWITDLERLPAGTNPERLETMARFTVFADETKMNRGTFRDMVAAIVNPS